MSRLLALFTAWLSRKANFRYAFIAERPDGVWEELFRLPSWMLPLAGEPHYPFGYADTDVRAVYLDLPSARRGSRADGKKIVLVDTQTERRRPQGYRPHHHDEEDN